MGPPAIPSIQKSENHVPSVISVEKLKQLYTAMVQLRVQNSGRRKQPYYFSEACEVASAIDLQLEDVVAALPNQRLSRLRGEGSSAPRNQLKVDAFKILEEES